MGYSIIAFIDLATKKPKTRNKFERRIEDQLKLAKVEFTYETAKIPYVIYGNYIPDFILRSKTGTIYLETKGYFRPEAKRKMVAVKKMHPDLDIRIIFYSSSTRQNRQYIRWANRNKFPYSFDVIPEEWLND